MLGFPVLFLYPLALITIQLQYMKYQKLPTIFLVSQNMGLTEVRRKQTLKMLRQKQALCPLCQLFSNPNNPMDQC